MPTEEIQETQTIPVRGEADESQPKTLPSVADILNNNSAAADHMVHPNRSDDGEKAFSGDGYANDIDTNAV